MPKISIILFILLTLVSVFGHSSEQQSEDCSKLFSSGVFRLQAPEDAEVIEMSFQQPHDHNYTFEKTDRDKAGEALKEMGLSKDIKTVLYPFSSYDAETMTRTFPDAINYIALDMSSFSKSVQSEIAPDFQLGPMAGNFHMTGQAWALESIAAAILARLGLSVPNIRVRSVRLIRMKKNRFVYGSVMPVTHGQIEFDSGPGTQIKTYTHIDTELSDDLLEVKPFWYTQLMDHGFEVMLTKADTGGFKSIAPALGGRLVDQLEEVNGIFLESDLGWLDYLDPELLSHSIPFPEFQGGYGSATLYLFGNKRDH